MKILTPYPVLGPASAALLRAAWQWFGVLQREYGEGGLQFRAMSLVYTTLLALAPMLAVSFSVLKAFGVHNEMQPMLFNLLEPLGANARDIGDKIIGFVENIQVGVLGFVGFLMLFYTATSLLHQVEDCFNHIWRVDRPRSLYRRFSDYLTVILIGPVLLFSAMGIAKSLTNASVVQKLAVITPFGGLYYLFAILLPYVLAVAGFTLAIAFVPNRSVTPKAALSGGVVAAIAWKFCGSMFALFVANSAQYSAIYSGFAVILLSMIWLYLSWLILLLGGVIAFHVQFPRYLRYTRRHPVLSIVEREYLGLRLMYALGRDHGRDSGLCTLQTLADEVDRPWEWVDEVLHALTDAGLLVVAAIEPKTYVLARDTDEILLIQIVRAVRQAGQGPLAPELMRDAVVAPFCDAAERAWAATLADTCLRDLVHGDRSIEWRPSSVEPEREHRDGEG